MKNLSFKVLILTVLTGILFPVQNALSQNVLPALQQEETESKTPKILTENLPPFLKAEQKAVNDGASKLNALTAEQKAPAKILESLIVGQAQEVIVQFDDQAIQQEAQQLNKEVGQTPRNKKQAMQTMLDFKSQRYSELKNTVISGLFGSLPLQLKQSGTVQSGQEISILQDYSHLPMMFIRVNSIAAMEKLLNHPAVVRVYENEKLFPSLQQSLPLIDQPAAAAAGYTGSGTSVVVIDTGVNYNNAAFGNCLYGPGSPGCKVLLSEDIAPDDYQLDDNGHGTNVSGIVAGVAPDAGLIVYDAYQCTGSGSSKQCGFDANVVIIGINRAIANQSSYNIQAINMSLGGGGYTGICSGNIPYETPIAQARDVGISVVVASGNEGYKNKIASPACTPYAVRVGAVYDDYLGTKSWLPTCSDNYTAPDQVICFSNSATFLSLLAPGAMITAADITMPGTSQASPHVAGAVAVLKSAFPSDSRDQTLLRMLNSGKPITDSFNNITKPRLDLDTAILGSGHQCGTPTVLTPGNLVNGSLSTTDCLSGFRSTYSKTYQFSGTAGQQIVLAMNSSVINSYLILIPPNGPIIEDDNGGGGNNSRIPSSSGSYTLTTTGTYRVVASAFDTFATGAFSLSLQPSASFPLTVTNVGNGTITSNPVGIDCGTDCSESYASGTSVTLTATPSAGNTFVGWSRDCTGLTCTLSMTAAKNVTATFNPIVPVPLGVALDNTTLVWSTTGDAPWIGQSAVSFLGGSAAQSGLILDNKASHLDTTVIGPGTLTFYWKVSSEANYDFLRFSMDGTASLPPVSGVVDWQQKTVSIPSGQHTLRWSYTKDFSSSVGADAGWVDAIVYSATPLTVTTIGQGKVTSNPAGIDCGTDCIESYASGTSVTLTAIPSAGYTFSGWSGDCAGSGTCVLSMTAAKSVTATFNITPPLQFPLTVSIIGQGKVTSNPEGINCGIECSEEYTSGTYVTLTAIPAAGYSFTGWSGACTGGTPSCVVSMTATKNVTATFQNNNPGGIATGMAVKKVVCSNGMTGQVYSIPFNNNNWDCTSRLIVRKNDSITMTITGTAN